MNTIIHSTKLFLFVLFCTATVISISYSAEENDFYAVATYECIGLYFKSPDLGAFELGRPPIRFGRRAEDDIWAPWELY